MATSWRKNKTEPYNLNNGYEFEKGGNNTIEMVNVANNNAFYAVDKAEEALAAAGSGGSGTTNHALLYNLDYANSNHTGFASETALTLKVDKVTGKSLIADTEIARLASVTNQTLASLGAAPITSPTFTGTVTLPATTSIGNVSSIELGYIDGVTSNIQIQLNSKQPTLVSATNIKTINGTTLLGSGNIEISGGGATIPVIDNLASTSTTSALSANQGRMLDINKAPISSPQFIGTPIAPTPATTDSSTRIATTAWVKAQGYGTGGGSTPIIDNLSSESTTSALSANQGRVLNTTKAPLENPEFTGNTFKVNATEDIHIGIQGGEPTANVDVEGRFCMVRGEEGLSLVSYEGAGIFSPAIVLATQISEDASLIMLTTVEDINTGFIHTLDTASGTQTHYADHGIDFDTPNLNWNKKQLATEEYVNDKIGDIATILASIVQGV